MPKRKPKPRARPKKAAPGKSTEQVTPLQRWMTKHRVQATEVAPRLAMLPQGVSALRRGVRRPSDRLKLLIQNVTLEMEREFGIADPRGVTVIDWFTAPEASAR